MCPYVPSHKKLRCQKMLLNKVVRYASRMIRMHSESSPSFLSLTKNSSLTTFCLTQFKYGRLLLLLKSIENVSCNTYNTVFLRVPKNYCFKPRTPQGMDGTLTLIFAKLEIIWNITTKISAFLLLGEKWILTKFEGCGSKIRPATPIWSFRFFWREIQIQGIKSLQIWYKVGTYLG